MFGVCFVQKSKTIFKDLGFCQETFEFCIIKRSKLETFSAKLKIFLPCLDLVSTFAFVECLIFLITKSILLARFGSSNEFQFHNNLLSKSYTFFFVSSLQEYRWKKNPNAPGRVFWLQIL